MEIFQTIWTELTSENEMLTKIIASVFMFIELYISMLLFITLLKIQSTPKQKITYVSILSFIGILTLWIIPVPYNTFINLFACPILVLIIFKANILKSILSELVPYIIFLLVSIPLVNIFNFERISLIPLYRIIYASFLYLIVFLLYKILDKLNISFSGIHISKTPRNHMLFTNFIIGIVSIAIQCYVVTIYYNTLPFSITLLNVLVLSIYFIFSMYALIRTNKLEATTQNLEEEKLYNKTLTILYDNIRGFKHDFNNIVQAIGGYISTDNMKGLKEYYSDLLEDCQKSNSLSVLNPELINNSAIYSLLTSKYHKADELGIKINLELFLDLTTLNIKTYQLTRILGILLDNAIEASSKCEEKIINIIIRKDNKISRQLFIIENTYLDKTVNIDRIFEKGYSSKTNEDTKNHGLGLWEVRQILKKNTNLNLHTTKDNNFFKQQLEIYNN